MGSVYVDEFVVGDLVEFVGYSYSPDYMYVVDDPPQYGIVVRADDHYHGDMGYQIYWFNTKNITAVVAGHLKLVYARKE